MFYVFGKEQYELIVVFVNYIFFLIPLYFIYKIGVELKDKETGNIAMILFALVPAVYGMSRQYGHQDYHIIAAITFNIYCLIKSDYFKDAKWSILYGISVGLGLMIKDAFVAYFFAPFVYAVAAGLKEKSDKVNIKIINIFFATSLGSLIAGWHYFRWPIIMKIFYEPITEQVPIFVNDSLKIMTTCLWTELFSPPIFIIFITGLIFFIWKYKGKYKNIILLWFFVPWAIIMFMPHHKLPQYGAGFIPAVILIGSVFISNINKYYVKKTIIAFLIIITTFQYVIFSYFNDKLFNDSLAFELKGLNLSITYYDSKNYLVKYHSETMHKYAVLFNRLNRYKKYTFCYNRNHIKLDMDPFLIRAHMYLNDISHIEIDYEYLDTLDFDIIMFIGQNSLKKIIEKAFKDILDNPINSRKFTKELKEKISKKIEATLDEIQKKYRKIDEFYINDKKDEDEKVVLYGRKDKFPEILK